MAASRDLRSRVTDVVTCPICLELFNRPKSLPCLHTFCLKCIEGHCRENEPGDEVAYCPVCRQKFNIPENGVKGLVNNFFIDDLVEALEDYRAPVVTFTPMKLFDVTQNFIGRVIEPHVVHTLPLPGTDVVVGVASLDDELYVLRDKEQVEVYNTTTTTTSQEEYRLVRTLSVPGEIDLFDMTLCKHYRCLYIASFSNCCVHRVELSGKVTKLSVSSQPSSLSVTSQFTLLVTCYESKLLELTTEGKQLREITLPDIVSPWHAIQLSNGQFVVCHGESVYGVCIIDTNCHVTQSYGGPRGSATVGQLDEPCHLAVDKDEFIFVLDNHNSRVLLLSPTLNFVSEIVSRDQLKGETLTMFLDVDRRRLYVTVGSRVVAVQL